MKETTMIIDEVAQCRAQCIHDALVPHLPGRLLDSEINIFPFFVKKQDGAVIEYRLDIEGTESTLTVHVPDDILLSSVAKMNTWLAEQIAQISASPPSA